MRIILEKGFCLLKRACVKLSSNLIGLLDDQGNKYVPSLVRIGPNAHPSLKNVTLEFLVDKEKEIRGTKNAEPNVIRNEVLLFL